MKLDFQDTLKRDAIGLTFKSSLKYKCYVCRMYEDVLEDNEWKEVIFSSFPININIEEAASTEDNKRTQIFIKYLELDLNSEERQLTLTI